MTFGGCPDVPLLPKVLPIRRSSEFQKGATCPLIILMGGARMPEGAPMINPETDHCGGRTMTLGEMRELSIRRLWISCLNRACGHDALLDASGRAGSFPSPALKVREVRWWERGRAPALE